MVCQYKFDKITKNHTFPDETGANLTGVGNTMTTNHRNFDS